MLSVRRQLTQILLQVTNEEMTELAQEALARAKMKQKGTEVTFTCINQFYSICIVMTLSLYKILFLVLSEVIITIERTERGEFVSITGLTGHVLLR